MTYRDESPASYRTCRSDFDCRAINVAGHLLLGIVWLERRIASVPERFSPLLELAGRRSEPTAPLRAPFVKGMTGNEERDDMQKLGRVG